jgi:hypothetical protein
VNTKIEPAVMNDRIPRVPGREHHLQLAASRADLNTSEFPAHISVASGS